MPQRKRERKREKNSTKRKDSLLKAIDFASHFKKKKKKIETGEPLRAPARSALHSRAAFAAFGLAYALEATKLIMDHMAKEPFEVIWWPLVLLSAGVLHSAVSRGRQNGPLLGVSPDAVVGVNLLIISVGYLHYVTSVISETCSFFGIRCLTIDVEKAKRAKEEAAAAEGRRSVAAAATKAAAAASNGNRAATRNGGTARKKAETPAVVATRRRRSSSRSRK